MPVKFVPPQTTTPIGAAMANFVAQLGQVPTQQEQAVTDLSRAKTDEQRRKTAAAATIEDVFNSVYNPQPVTSTVETPRPSPDMQGPMPVTTTTSTPSTEELLRKNLPRLAGATASAEQYGQIGNLFRTIIANDPDLKNTGMIDRAMLGAGDAYGSTMGGTREKNAADFARTKYTVDAATARAEKGTPKQQLDAEKMAKGKDDFESVLKELNDAYTTLDTQGGAVSQDNDPVTNALNYVASTKGGDGWTGFIPGGQDFGRMFGTDAQATRDLIAAKIPLLSAAIKNATGMSSQQLNSNFELQQYMRALSDPKTRADTNKQILQSLSKLYGRGGLATVEGEPAAPAAPAGGGGVQLYDLEGNPI